MKAAFTRAYNKESHLTPYSLQAVKKGRKGAVDPDLALDPDNDLQGQEEEEEEETLNTDAMVKVSTIKLIKLWILRFLYLQPINNHCTRSNCVYRKIWFRLQI